ncbi:hypothetical protein H6P81_009721 [Aristolochia fimbriata]|uniref:Serine/threonine-protein kinase BSK1-like TPR repeats domain-containing protein n=1 Tax=Aristolochia fimbriata TaxID=158543 RepID=A0AAV7EPD7_ARIFI|nr:hypothetical protein H6P81_009721 [Aristolochia fimbriata]
MDLTAIHEILEKVGYKDDDEGIANEFIDGGTIYGLPNCIRSALLVMSDMPQEALADATQAQVVSPEWATAFYLQAAALFSLGMDNDAQDTLKDGSALEGGSKRIAETETCIVLPTSEPSPKKEIMMIMQAQKGPSLSPSKKKNIETAIDSLRYMGDVGETDINLLKEILPHCTAEQLMHIENSSKGRDLSSVTATLWKKFYEQHFGEETINLVLSQYDEKIPAAPSSCCKRGFSAAGSSTTTTTTTKGGNLMKKARTEFLNSHELRARQAMKKKTCMY